LFYVPYLLADPATQAVESVPSDEDEDDEDAENNDPALDDGNVCDLVISLSH
jgi:hypothetical protein